MKAGKRHSGGIFGVIEADAGFIRSEKKGGHRGPPFQCIIQKSKQHSLSFCGLGEEAFHPVGAGVLFGQRHGNVLGFDAHVEVSAKALHA